MRSSGKMVGCCVIAFGLGMLTALFLPHSVLIVLEALVIVSAGVIYIKC